MLAPAARLRHPARADRLIVLTRDEPGVVLVDVQLSVHPERVGVRAEETLDVRMRGQLVEPLVFEGAQILRPHFRAELHLVEVEALALARLSKAGADLEHARNSLPIERVRSPDRDQSTASSVP